MGVRAASKNESVLSPYNTAKQKQNILGSRNDCFTRGTCNLSRAISEIEVIINFTKQPKEKCPEYRLPYC